MSFKKNVTIYNVPISNVDVEIYKVEIMSNVQIVIDYLYKDSTDGKQLGEINRLVVPAYIEDVLNQDYYDFDNSIMKSEKLVKKLVFKDIV